MPGECVIFLVLSCHNKNLKQWILKPSAHHSSRTVLQLCVTAQFYLENKGKHILEAWRHADPKELKRWEKEREREHTCAHASGRERPHPTLWFLFLYVLSSPIGLARSTVCSTWGPHSGLWTFLCSIFEGFLLPCLLATAILDSFFLF